MTSSNPEYAELIERLRDLDAKATPAPWRYRPDEYDDWGAVKAPVDEEGRSFWIAQIRDPRVHEDADLSEHRSKGTDPWEANARLVVEARNSVPVLLTALDRLSSDREMLREARDAIASLPEDALGYGQPAFAHDADLHRWPLRDELLSRINTALGDKE